MENITIFSTNNDSYLYAAIYEEYIQNKIMNEGILVESISQYIPINEATYKNQYAIMEAKLTYRAKLLWDKFISFIKNIFGRFKEQISRILLNEKEYLEKYKNIILGKKPKPKMDYQYDGDYKVAIRRCIDTIVPVFNYDKFGAALKEDGDEAVIKLIMSGTTGFVYDAGSDLATMFKTYFLGAENGKISKGSFSDLDFKTMYDFCYNHKNIQSIVDKDLNYLNQSTTAINNAIQAKFTNNKQHESTLYISEAKDGENKPSTDVTITNTDATSQMGSYTNDRKDIDNTEKEGNASLATDPKENNNEQIISDICAKWIRICKYLITAKLTAVQQISKNYMKIIHAHVESYVGIDKNNKDNRDQYQPGETYEKHPVNNK